MAPKTHKIVWTDSAALDLAEIVRFIATDAPTNARRLLSKIRTGAAGLVRFPDRGRVVPELAVHGVVVFRELLLRPYRIIYRVHERDVNVLAVMDGRRDVEDLLLERLTCRQTEFKGYDVGEHGPRKKK